MEREKRKSAAGKKIHFGLRYLYTGIGLWVFEGGGAILLRPLTY
jgi:hypothetical protein